jgi:predicted alpha/beta superfamily hydrolase
MKNPQRKMKGWLTLLIGICTAHLFGQPNAIMQMANSETHVISSIYTKKEYQLRVLLPHGYSAADELKYPVLYVLDGKFAYGTFTAIIENFALGKELKEPIVVTVDGDSLTTLDWLVNRHYDYTPSYDPKADTDIANYLKLPPLTSGGAAAFLAMLEQEIIPLIDRNYKTTPERGLFGHSLGGLFVGYCLTTSPNLFQKYSLNSPSFWWKEGELITKMNALEIQDPKTAVAIFISVGSLEGDFMISPVQEFEKSLRKKFPKANITSKVFEEETHLSVVPMACSRTLRLFYAKTAMAGF